MAKRTCDICGSPLLGRLGHGFVVDNGRKVICGDYRRHDRIKRKRKWSYEEETKEKEDRTVLTSTS